MDMDSRRDFYDTKFEFTESGNNKDDDKKDKEGDGVGE